MTGRGEIFVEQGAAALVDPRQSPNEGLSIRRLRVSQDAVDEAIHQRCLGARRVRRRNDQLRQHDDGLVLMGGEDSRPPVCSGSRCLCRARVRLFTRERGQRFDPVGRGGGPNGNGTERLQGLSSIHWWELLRGCRV